MARVGAGVRFQGGICVAIIGISVMLAGCGAFRIFCTLIRAPIGVATEFRWDVSNRNNVASRATYTVYGKVDGKSGHRNVTDVSQRAKVSDWVVDSGAAIGEALDRMSGEAAQLIWERILAKAES